jgi:hypothetical protein
MGNRREIGRGVSDRDGTSGFSVGVFIATERPEFGLED